MNPATIFVVVLFGAAVGTVSAKDYEVTISIPRKIGQFSITGFALKSAMLVHLPLENYTDFHMANVDVKPTVSRDEVVIDMIANEFPQKPHYLVPAVIDFSGSHRVEPAEMQFEAEVENKSQVVATDTQQQKPIFTANMAIIVLESPNIRVETKNYWQLEKVEGSSETEGPSGAALQLTPPQGSNCESDMHTIIDTSIVYRPGTTIGEVTLTVTDMTKFEITATAETIEHLLKNRATTGDTIELKGETSSITIGQQVEVTSDFSARGQQVEVKYKIKLLQGRGSYYFPSWRADQIKDTLLKDTIITDVVVSMWQPSKMDLKKNDSGLKIKVPDVVNAFTIGSRWRQDPTRTNGEDDFIMFTTVRREGNGWTVTSMMDLSVDTSVEEKINCNQNSSEDGPVRRRRLDEDGVYDCLGESGRNSAGSGPSKVSIVLMSVLIPLGFIGIVIVACYYRRRQKPEATEQELGPDIEFPTKMQGLGYARDLRIGGVADEQA